MIAGIIFTWFALISYFLIKIFRQSRFYIIPLAIGAWLAGLALAAFTLVFWGDYFLNYWNHLCCCSYNFTNKIAKLFHPAVCILFICEWTDCFLFHLGSETDQILWVLIAQIFILCISYFLKPHWFFILIQMLATYGIAVIYLLQMDHSLWSLNSTQTYLNLVLLNYLVLARYY